MNVDLSTLRSLLISKPPLLAIVFGGIMLAVSALFIHSETERLKGEEILSGYSQLSTLRAQLEGEIGKNLAVLRALRAEVAIKPDMDQAYFSRLMKELLDGGTHIRHMALAPDLIVKYLYPLEGNEKAIGLDYRVLPEQMASIQEAIILETMTLSGPLTLVQGGVALIVRMPVFVGQGEARRLWGVISAVLHYDELLNTAGFRRLPAGMLVGLKGRDGTGSEGEVFHGSPKAFAPDAILTAVTLPHGEWQMAMRPINGWAAPTERLYLMWGGATILSLLMAVVGWLLAQAYRAKNHAMATANYRANYDGLTGLPNRYYFSQRLSHLISAMRREQQDFAIFFIDIDHFKQVNDSIGHVAGDQLLIEFAERLQSSARDSDIVARLAGDEFVLVLRNVGDVIQADLLAEKLRARLQQPYLLEGRQHVISASIGIAMFPVDGEDVTSLLLHSDQAMYAAKRAGRNAHFFYNEGMREEAEHHLVVHADILRGLEAHEFELFYQPILNLDTQQVDKCEALIRWRHPERGLVMPDEFIGVAERTGAIRDLGNWVLKQACRDFRTLQDAGVDLDISINRSVGEFVSSRTYDTWKQIFTDNQVDPARFIFEITESLFMEKHVARMSVISALRKLGVRFAIDDFGTGYSAINYLRNYPADFLKIDRSFVQDIMHDEQDATLVEVILKMGNALGIIVVAEGVEEAEQVEFLQQHGCHFVQGYWLARPMPLNALILSMHERMAASGDA